MVFVSTHIEIDLLILTLWLLFIKHKFNSIVLWVKMYNKESKKVLDIRHNQSKLNIYFLLPFESIVIMTS
jgi:hypothetical protein